VSRLALVSCFAVLPPVAAATAPQAQTTPPGIVLIIDDMGNQQLPGLRVINLDAPVACAIMPHTAHATRLATQAHAAGKEVILHWPMQSVEMQKWSGPGEISLDTSRDELNRILERNLQSVPHATGVSNHMGSLITRHPGHMGWLMEELSRRGNLYFIDSVTTPDSVAYRIARQNGVPALRRHVFLDHEQTEAAVSEQFERLKARAREYGYAIGIGHPYPVTLDFLEREIPLLQEEGIRLISMSELIKTQSAEVQRQ